MTWPTTRIDRVADEVRESVDPSLIDGEVTHWSIPALDATGGPLVEAASSIGSAKMRLRGGEVLVSRLNPRKARVVRVPEHLDGVHLCSGEFVVLRPRAVEARFLEYLLLSESTRQLLDAHVQSVTRSHQRVRPELVRHLEVPMPSIRAQRAIADYLDTETTRIDTLIAKKKEQLGLLGLAVASRVEEALEAHAADRVPLRRLLAEPPQYGAGESGEAETPGWPRYIRITDLEADGSLRTDDVRCLHPTTAQPYLLEGGDVLVARSGATVGKAFIYREGMGAAAFAGYLIRLRFARSRLLPGIFKHWTQTEGYWDQIAAAAVQATIQNVSAEKYKDLLVPLPPISAQEALLGTFDGIAGTASKARCALTSQLSRLVEHRQALITAAVTGELDIPGVAA